MTKRSESCRWGQLHFLCLEAPVSPLRPPAALKPNLGLESGGEKDQVEARVGVRGADGGISPSPPPPLWQVSSWASGKHAGVCLTRLSGPQRPV